MKDGLRSRRSTYPIEATRGTYTLHSAWLDGECIGEWVAGAGKWVQIAGHAGVTFGDWDFADWRDRVKEEAADRLTAEMVVGVALASGMSTEAAARQLRPIIRGLLG